MDKTGLVSLLQSPHIWRMGDMPQLERTGWPTGFETLDAELPEGGWPKQGLIELLCDRTGIGEVSLLLHALAALSAEQRSIAWINPPFLPYAPALSNAGIDISRVLIIRPDAHAETLWAAEQTLRSGAMGAVLVWLKQDVEYSCLRRLQLAAETGRTAGFLYRHSLFATQPSPAPLRVRVDGKENALAATLLKRRGLMGSRHIVLAANNHTVVRPAVQSDLGLLTARH